MVESMVLLGQGNRYCAADSDTDVLIGFAPSETIRAAKKFTAGSVVIKMVFVDVNLKAFESGMNAAGKTMMKNWVYLFDVGNRMVSSTL